MNQPDASPEAICDLVSRNFSLPRAELSADSSLFAKGTLDSFHLLELVTLLEKTYGRRIASGEMHLGNLDSPGKISAFLAARSA